MPSPLFFRRYVPFLFLFVFLAAASHAQGISYQLPVDSTGVGKILGYTLCLNIQNEIEYLNKRIQDRVYLETHLGAAYYYDLGAQPMLGIKFNCINPKLPYYRLIKAKIFKVREMAKALNGTIDSVSGRRLSEIESVLAAYDKNKWKRFSVSITTPVSLWRYDTLYYWNPVDSSYENHINSNFYPHLLRVFGFSLGYDIQDIATVNIGSTIHEPREIYGSVTFDISTPAYMAVSGFLNQLRALLYPNIPGTSSVEGYY